MSSDDGGEYDAFTGSTDSTVLSSPSVEVSNDSLGNPSSSRESRGSFTSLNQRQLRTSKRYPANTKADGISVELLERIIGGEEADDRIRRGNKNLRELTINKLQYDAVGLVGRKREIEILEDCLFRLKSVGEGGRRKELALIKGTSGVGKSTLASTFEKSISKMTNAISAKGKFDLNSGDEPYSALAAAFGGICRRITTSINPGVNPQSTIASSIGSAISSELGSVETRLLEKLIPELIDILPSIPKSNTPDIPDVNDGAKAGQEKWRYVFRTLAKIINAFFSPMVLILDDLQWADVESLNIIDALLSDTQNVNGLMILGSYRLNEVDETHILSDLIKSLSQKEPSLGLNLTEIELKNLQVAEVNKIIMLLLAIDDENKTQQLADICFRRTLGNPFFLFEFVAMLEEEGILSYNLGTLQWMWRESEVEMVTVATENVVDLLRTQMQKLAPQVQLFLQYASCLGHSFRSAVLEILWNKSEGQQTQSNSNVTEMLLSLERERFIEGVDGNEAYRWVHDKVQEAALSLGNANDAWFQAQIGALLYSELSEEQLEDSLFTVVNLIDEGRVKDRPDFAKLCLRASLKARAISAFHSASKYATKGIKLLPTDKWESHHSLTLQLFTTAAETELAVGRGEATEKCCKEILNRKDCSTVEKIPVYAVRFQKLSAMDLAYSDAIKLGLQVLRELDFPLPSRGIALPIRALASFLRTAKHMKKIGKDFWKIPKLASDPKHKAAMLFLSLLPHVCIMNGGGNEDLVLLAVIRTVQLTLSHGATAFSGSSFVTFGLFVGQILEDFQSGEQLAETGLLIQKSFPYTTAEARTLFVASTIVLPWTKPIHSFATSYSEAYLAAMRSGSSEDAMFSLLSAAFMQPYAIGKPLNTILLKCPDLVAQAEDLKQKELCFIARAYWQIALNLTGQSEETTTLTGEALNGDEFPISTAQSELNHAWGELELAVYFDDLEAAATYAIERGDKFLKTAPGLFVGMIETFHRGVALYAMALRTRKRKYKVHARRVRRTISMWAEKGNPNVRHFRCLLDAEEAALQKKYASAKQLYEEAIKLAGRSGYIHDAALCNERYSEFLLRDLSDEEESMYRINEAIRYYEEWGAEAKVHQLQAKTRSNTDTGCVVVVA